MQIDASDTPTTDCPPPPPQTPPQPTPQPPPPPPIQPTPPQSSKGKGCLKGCLITLAAAFLLCVLGSVICGILFTQAILEGIHAIHESEEAEFSRDASGLSETWDSAYNLPNDFYLNPARAIRIPLSGTIDFSASESSLFRGNNSAAIALRSIRRATQDKAIDAILLEVDSGGGGMTASDILYHELLRFKKARSGRTIVVLMGDIAASGAYYASLAADTIIAHPTSITGSIGVILPSYNIQQLTDKLGVIDNSIASGPNKSILNPLRELTPEQHDLLQDTVDELYTRFASLVSLHRNIPLDTVKSIADGRLYTASQAQNLNLIDSIGYLEDAQEAIYHNLGSPEQGLSFYIYERHTSLRELISSPDFWGAAISHAIPKNSLPSEPRPQAR